MERDNRGYFRDIPGYSGRFSTIASIDNVEVEKTYNRNWEPPVDYQENMDKDNQWSPNSRYHQRYPASTAASTVDGDDSDGNPKTFKRVLVRFADRTSMQGIPYINTSKTWLAKSIWSLLMITALAVMVLHLFTLITAYIQFEKKTKITLGFNNLSFPTVTFCNVNPVKMSKFHLMNPDLREFLTSIQPETVASSLKRKRQGMNSNLNQPQSGNDPDDDDDGNSNQSPWQNAGRRKKRFVDDVQFNFTNIGREVEDEKPQKKRRPNGQKSQLKELRDEFDYLFTAHTRNKRIAMGHRLSDMMVSCSFSGINCDARDFSVHPTTTYGNCFSLENQDFVSYKSGPNDGLEMILFLETDEYIPLIASGFGAQLHVQENETWPDPETQGMAVSAGMETHVAMRMMNIQRIGGWYGDCDTGEDFKNKYGLKYTRQTCQLLCVQEKIISECECFDDESYEFASSIHEEVLNGSLPPCRSRSRVSCMVDVKQDWDIGEFSCPCDNPCYETTYQLKSSSRTWPSDAYASMLVEFLCNRMNDTECEKLEKMDPRKLNQNFMKISIYFEDLNFEEIVEVPDYEDVQFYSDIGGTVGLWVGLSVLSLAEVAQFVFEVFHFLLCVRPRRQKERAQRTQNSQGKVGN